MRSTHSTLTAAGALASDLRLQADSSAAEVRSTAQVTRRTLATFQELGKQGIQRLASADADLRANGPQLLQTLRRLDAMVAKLDGLVDRLSHSWLIDLLGDPSRVPAPLGPPAKGAVDPAGGQRSGPGRPDAKGPASATVQGGH
jgi:hypothetical protein